MIHAFLWESYRWTSSTHRFLPPPHFSTQLSLSFGYCFWFSQWPLAFEVKPLTPVEALAPTLQGDKCCGATGRSSGVRDKLLPQGARFHLLGKTKLSPHSGGDSTREKGHDSYLWVSPSKEQTEPLPATVPSLQNWHCHQDNLIISLIYQLRLKDHKPRETLHYSFLSG